MADSHLHSAADAIWNNYLFSAANSLSTTFASGNRFNLFTRTTHMREERQASGLPRITMTLKSDFMFEPNYGNVLNRISHTISLVVQTNYYLTSEIADLQDTICNAIEKGKDSFGLAFIQVWGPITGQFFEDDDERLGFELNIPILYTRTGTS